MDRKRAPLLAQTFKELNAVFASHTRRLPSNLTPSASSMAITRVNVTFSEEPGEGNGVVRSFYLLPLARRCWPMRSCLCWTGCCPVNRGLVVVVALQRRRPRRRALQQLQLDHPRLTTEQLDPLVQVLLLPTTLT